MSTWDRLLALTAATPFTGTWMRLGTGLVALVALTALRRLLPREDRHHGRATLTFIAIGIALACVRLLLVTAGAGGSSVGKVVGAFSTFFVALGAVGTLIMAAFEIVPLRAHMRVPSIIREIAQVLGFLVVAFGLMAQAGVPVNNLLTGSAVLTAILGLALQSTLSNLFAGIVLHMDRSLSAGDWVQVGTRTGRIAMIRWRSTILRTTDGDTVIIPNSRMTAEEVHNFSRPAPRHRVWLKMSLPYRHPPNDVRRMLREAASATPGVLTDPPPDAFPVDFGESALVYALRYWIDDFGRLSDIDGEVRTRIWYAARRAQMEIPYPIRMMVNSTPDPGAESRVVPQRVEALSHVDLFSPLERTELEVLAQGLREVQFAAGEAIIRQGEAGDSLFLIAHGEVRVLLGDRGKEQEVARLRTGDFIGEMSLMTGENRAATCVAAVDTLCYEVDHAAFQRLVTLRPQIADHMSAMLAARQATLVQKGGELSVLVAQGAADNKRRLLAKVRSWFDLE